MSDKSQSGVAPLFPKPIPIIGVTGDHESGKSVFCLTVCRGPQTLVYDMEQSSASYDDFGHHRVNVLAEMHRTHPNGYKPVDLFNWWLKHVRSLEAGKYRVIVIDPVTDLDSGLKDWVSANPQAFGHTAQQYAKMSGIMWGDIKTYLKSIMADLSVRCETLAYTSHLGSEFEDNKPTGRMKPKGMSTFRELASLYLWLYRKPDAKGNKPNEPTARVLKSRLMATSFSGDGKFVMRQVLPPVMPVCTPDTIRDAFASPAGGREIDDIERHVEETLSDEDRLRLEVAKAEAERDAVQGKLALAANPAAGGGKPTPPPEADAVAWLDAAKTAAELVAAAGLIAAFAWDEATRARLRARYDARKGELAAPKADTPAEGGAS